MVQYEGMSKISPSQKTNTAPSHLYDISKVLRFVETESRMMVTKGWGEGKWSSLMEIEEKILDPSYKMCILNTTKQYT